MAGIGGIDRGGVDPMMAVADRLRAGDFAEALRLTERILVQTPFAPPPLGAAAFAALRLGKRDVAAAMMRRLIAVLPDDVATRGNLATLLVEDGRHAEALAIVRPHRGSARLAALEGWLHQEAGAFAQAASAYEAALAIRPDDGELWTNLGNVRASSGDRAGAAEAFNRAIQAGISHPDVFVAFSAALTAPEARETRLAVVAEGLRRFPGHAGLGLEHGLALAGAEDPEPAITALKAAVARETHFGPAHLELGLFYENLNRIDALAALVRDASAKGFEAPEMNLLRGWIAFREGQFENADRYAQAIPSTISSIRSAHLRGQIAERRGDATTAFAQFAAMNRAMVAEDGTPPGETYRELVRRETAVIRKSAKLAPVLSAGGGPPDPICVVGFPRSGTTLLDTLLSALPELQVFEEQPMLDEVCEAFPDLALMSDAQRVRQARLAYHVAATRIFGAAAGRRIVDKHPLHMAQMAPLHRLFPSASIVLVERHPCDVVLSCFMANFTLNHAMRSFTDIEETAHVYDAVFSSFAEAEALLPLRVHRVRYERMVTNLEGEMRGLLDFLEIGWRDAVLDNQAASRHRGHVRTASYAQVGQPIYRHASERWRRYRDQLAPVLPILEPWVERMGYSL